MNSQTTQQGFIQRIRLLLDKMISWKGADKLTSFWMITANKKMWDINFNVLSKKI